VLADVLSLHANNTHICTTELGETGRCYTCKGQATVICHAIIACLELQANISSADITTALQGAWGCAYVIFFGHVLIHLPSCSRQCSRSGRLVCLLTMRLGDLHFG